MEFVSANPTGPITVASGRHAAYGDSLCRILEYAGNEVEREYYVNDAGTQVRRFGESIRARARGEEPPEDGYHGDYVAELAAAIEGAADADPDELAGAAIELMLEGVRDDARALPRAAWTVFSRAQLHDCGRDRGCARGGSRSRARLRVTRAPPGCAPPLVRRRQGPRAAALERRATPTSASDIAYHADKLARGYDRAIDVWGADHHGYISRMQRRLGGARRRPRRASRS